MLADAFENFRNKCSEIYELDMLLIVEKGTKGGICQAIHRHAKANNKYMKNYDIYIISSYLIYLNANNLYGFAMSQKLAVNGFKWVEKSRLSRLNDIFIKTYNENSDKGYFLEVDIDCLKKLFNLHKGLPFLPKSKKVNNLWHRRQRKICCAYENLKTTLKSWISI